MNARDLAAKAVSRVSSLFPLFLSVGEDRLEESLGSFEWNVRNRRTRERKREEGRAGKPQSSRETDHPEHHECASRREKDHGRTRDVLDTAAAR